MNFIERVFAMARWRAFLAARPRPRDLVAFHAAQKFAVLAHSPAHYARLGRLVATAGERGDLAAAPRGASATLAQPETARRFASLLSEYGVLLMRSLRVRATRARHANVLQHLAGFLKKQLGAEERGELAEIVEDYRRGLLPLLVPITLVKHHVRRLGVEYLADQVYLSPHPKELMLRNHMRGRWP